MASLLTAAPVCSAPLSTKMHRYWLVAHARPSLEFSRDHPVSIAQGQSSDVGRALTSEEPGRTYTRGRLDGFTKQTLACLIPELPPPVEPT